MEYQKTKDENIIEQIETIESEIFIDKLEAEIKDLETADYVPLQYPAKASDELKQAIDMYNEPEIAMQMQNEELLAEKKELLIKCKAVK